jgi:FKBP-type peptidyl-prolyl cis-trans isomerase
MAKVSKLRMTLGGMMLLVALAAVVINALRPSHTRIIDVKLGSGPAVKKGDRVIVHVVGKIGNGRVFDGSILLPFEVGRGMVIQGLDVGLIGMQVGGVRQLIIPPDEAYGSRGVGGIPPNSTLQFEIELLAIP